MKFFKNWTKFRGYSALELILDATFEAGFARTPPDFNKNGLRIAHWGAGLALCGPSPQSVTPIRPNTLTRSGALPPKSNLDENDIDG